LAFRLRQLPVMLQDTHQVAAFSGQQASARPLPHHRAMWHVEVCLVSNRRTSTLPQRAGRIVTRRQQAASQHLALWCRRVWR
jgi:hypothetical protein